MLDACSIAARHDGRTSAWHESYPTDSADPATGLMTLVEQQHRANFDLWHEEDKARDPQATALEIVRVKLEIDRLNQQRNDLVERIDEILLEHSPTDSPDAPLHSETPGMMIDRLSILALKIYHMREESKRGPSDHRQSSLHRLAKLEEQRADLVACLATLWQQILNGQRRFKLYRQMKMYNDPEFNPSVYGRKSS